MTYAGPGLPGTVEEYHEDDGLPSRSGMNFRNVPFPGGIPCKAGVKIPLRN